MEPLQHRAMPTNMFCSSLPIIRGRLASTSQGSSSESEDEGSRGSRAQVSGGSSGADDNSSDEEESGDEEMGWMSDAESVGSDEVAKLHSEAGDWVGYSTEDDDEVHIVSRFSEFFGACSANRFQTGTTLSACIVLFLLFHAGAPVRARYDQLYVLFDMTPFRGANT